MKSEDVPVEPPSVNHDTESQKATVVIQAPANTDREEVESSQQQGPSAEAKKELHRYHKKIMSEASMKESSCISCKFETLSSKSA
ncbi:transcription initiation factor TFIID subunit 1-like [Prunus yedoensis var. nudiflora]|uniref:Transcription initiation factor TFIID subunit 1-like n=1 Tax=Prunus yedoensis var. nudiflora TaxID=2094558 RepID=A0A314YS53_PRUYE|nr:transcription initiation factor TFIID subunit 1-like [Prunus yedoensis var. nudiflora]